MTEPAPLELITYPTDPERRALIGLRVLANIGHGFALLDTDQARNLADALLDAVAKIETRQRSERENQEETTK